MTSRRIQLAQLWVSLLPIANWGWSLSFGASSVHWLDQLYAWQCPRSDDRTLTAWGTAFPLCARCLGIHLGLGVGALAAVFRPPARIAAVAFGLVLAVMALDVATEALAMRPPSASLRLLTGVWVSATATLLLVRSTQERAQMRSRPVERSRPLTGESGADRKQRDTQTRH